MRQQSHKLSLEEIVNALIPGHPKDWYTVNPKRFLLILTSLQKNLGHKNVYNVLREYFDFDNNDDWYWHNNRELIPLFINHETVIPQFISDNPQSWRKIFKEFNMKLLSGWKSIQQNVVRPKGNFIWEFFCNTFGDQNTNRLRETANLLGIDTTNLNKAQLCAKIQNTVQRSQVFNPTHTCDISETDPFSQEEISTLPSWRRFQFKNKCYDLFALIEHNVVHDPYTREPLPVDEIHDQYKKIKPFLLDSAIAGAKDLVADVRNTPILTEAQLMQDGFVMIWSKMIYPPPIEAFLSATNLQLDEIWSNLFDLEIIRITQTDVEKWNIATTPIAKLKVLLDVFHRNAFAIEDEHTTTRLQGIEWTLNNIFKESAIATGRRRRFS